MLFSVIDEPFIDFIGDHQQILFDDQVRQLLQGLPRQYAAGGIVGGHDDDGPCFVRYLGADLLHVQLIAVFLLQLVGDGNGV